MKLFFATVLTVFSLSSFASWNEVECEGKLDGKSLELNIERPFPSGSPYRRVQLFVTENGAEEVFDFTVMVRRWGMDSLVYQDRNLRLEIDLWPDSQPQWGRTYMSDLQTPVLGRKPVRGFRCRFPNAF